MPKTGTMRRGEQAVRVIWTTVTQYETTLPVTAWERIGGAEGDTGERPVDAYLADLEADGGDTIERTVTSLENGFEL
jgi:hypothetical protein